MSTKGIKHFLGAFRPGPGTRYARLFHTNLIPGDAAFPSSGLSQASVTTLVIWDCESVHTCVFYCTQARDKARASFVAHHRASLPIQPLHLALEMQSPKEGSRAQSHKELASSSSPGLPSLWQ